MAPTPPAALATAGGAAAVDTDDLPALEGEETDDEQERPAGLAAVIASPASAAPQRASPERGGQTQQPELQPGRQPARRTERNVVPALDDKQREERAARQLAQSLLPRRLASWDHVADAEDDFLADIVLTCGRGAGQTRTSFERRALGINVVATWGPGAWGAPAACLQ